MVKCIFCGSSKDIILAVKLNKNCISQRLNSILILSARVILHIIAVSCSETEKLRTRNGATVLPKAEILKSFLKHLFFL